MPAPCPVVAEGSWWDDDVLGSVFFLSVMLLITCVPTYFVKVLVQGEVRVVRFRLARIPGWLPLLALAALPTQRVYGLLGIPSVLHRSGFRTKHKL